MASKKKKIKSSGRFGAGYGTVVRNRLNSIESVQRKRQKCPFCARAGIKRVAAGIWSCPKCGKKFANAAYTINKQI